MALKLNNLLGGKAPEVKPKRGRPPKNTQTNSKQPTKQKEPIKPKITKPQSVRTEVPKPVTSKPVTPKATTPPTCHSTTTWVKSINKQPEDLRPILFNTRCKKPVTGYKLRNGYVTNTPYFIDKFKKENGYIEWKYVSYCASLSRCPNEFPNCINCKHNKEDKKK